MAKRFLRFFPLMAVTAAADQGARLLYQLVLNHPYDSGLSLWGVILSGLGIQAGGVFSSQAVNNPTWYINCLLICYAVLYLLSWISKKLSIPTIWLYYIMIAIGAGAITYGMYYPFLTYHTARAYLAFFTGIFLAVFMLRNSIDKNKWVQIGCFLFLSFFIFLWLFARSTVKSDLQFLLVFTVFPCILILFRSLLLRHLFSQRVWTFLGAIAFNTYMWHADVIIIMNLLRIILPSEIYSTRLSMILFAVVCFALGTVLYYLLDKPLAAFIQKKLTKSSVSTTV